MLELDPELQIILVGFVTFLVTEGLKALGGLFGIDLSGAGSAVTAGIVALLLTFINALLGFIPPEYHEIARAVMSFLVVLLGAFGLHRQLKRFEPFKG